jgi:hypothetical protein
VSSAKILYAGVRRGRKRVNCKSEFSNVTEIAVRKMKNFIIKIVSVRIIQIKL